jgi:hypothetical protein
LSPTALTPLEPWREYITIVSNTDVRNAEAFLPPEIGGDHFRSAAVFLTQSHPKQTQGSDLLSGTSLDQLFAQKYGQETPMPSMQLCVENVDQAWRLLLRLFVRLHRLDQLGDAGRAAADDSAIRARCSISCSASAPRPKRAPPAAAATRAFLDWVTQSTNELKRSLGRRRSGQACRLSRRRA